MDTDLLARHAGVLAGSAAPDNEAGLEAALRQRAEQFATLLHKAPLGVYLIDADFRIRDANPTARRVFGDLPDLIGRDLAQIIQARWPAGYAHEVLELFRRTLESGEPYTSPPRSEERVEPRENGYYEWQIHRIVLPGGDFGVVCYFREISAELLARQSISDAAERYRSLVSVLSDVAWSADSNGAFHEWQEAWSAYTGQTWEECRGFGWLDVVHPEERAAVQQRWGDASRSGANYEASGRLWNASLREYRYVVVRATPLRNPDGSIREWVGTCTDVHEARVKQETLLALNREREELLAIAERAREEAEKANHAKDEFLAVLSHELRSPLNAMLGWTSILKKVGSTEALIARAVETLERNILTQSQIINDLLDVSRITSGKLQLDRTRVDLGAAIKGTIDSMQPMADGRQIAIELAPCIRRFDVHGDAARLQQIIGNILHNAIKFTPANGRIRVGVFAAEDSVTIEIEDSGPGIDPALLPHIFDRFVQSGSSTTRKHGGLGLGLAIVHQLTALHGGTVHVENVQPGTGVKFAIRLPLCEAQLLLEDSRERAEAPATTRTGSLDVLLVEDDPDSREALGIALRHGGIAVRLAASVRQALQAYDSHPPDLLVSDIGMPDEDGYALIRAVREREDGTSRHTLAIAITGFATRQDHEAALRAGFDEHVGKPVEPEALLERVRVLAESREAARRQPFK